MTSQERIRPGGEPQLRVVHADDRLVVVDKPPGRLVIPGRGLPEVTLKEEAEAVFGRLWVVHRLDRGTSGLLVFARTAEAHRTLNLAFDRREVAKRYLALVKGCPPAEQRITVAIAPARKGRMRPATPGDERGKSAETLIRLLETFGPCAGLPAFALVEALPETGRTHQIRVHLSYMETPLLLDPDYGEAGPLLGDGGTILLQRTPLHASALELRHPATGEWSHFEAPLPEDMARVLAVARGGG